MSSHEVFGCREAAEIQEHDGSRGLWVELEGEC